MNVTNSVTIALSGLQAAETQLSVAASNIANADAKGYKASRANLSDLPDNGGVSVSSITRDPSPGYVDEQGQEGSNTDPATQTVHLMLAKTLYNANAAVVRVASQMSGTLLDMLDHERK